MENIVCMAFHAICNEIYRFREKHMWFWEIAFNFVYWYTWNNSKWQLKYFLHIHLKVLPQKSSSIKWKSATATETIFVWNKKFIFDIKISFVRLLFQRNFLIQKVLEKDIWWAFYCFLLQDVETYHLFTLNDYHKMKENFKFEIFYVKLHHFFDEKSNEIVSLFLPCVIFHLDRHSVWLQNEIFGIFSFVYGKVFHVKKEFPWFFLLHFVLRKVGNLIFIINHVEIAILIPPSNLSNYLLLLRIASTHKEWSEAFFLKKPTWVCKRVHPTFCNKEKYSILKRTWKVENWQRRRKFNYFPTRQFVALYKKV